MSRPGLGRTSMWNMWMNKNAQAKIKEYNPPDYATEITAVRVDTVKHNPSMGY